MRSRPILATLSAPVRSDLLFRFEDSVDRSGGPDACWPWPRTKVNGYGVMWTREPADKRRLVRLHRLAFEVAGGDPTVEHVDHLCHDFNDCPGGKSCPHRACCNPAHLAGVTAAQNIRRSKLMRYRSECSRGHPLNEETAYDTGSGRQCRTCSADRAQKARVAERARRGPSKRRASYRPRGLSREQLTDWLLAGSEVTDVGCLIPPVTIPAGGYPSVRVGDSMVSAHRLVFEVRNRALGKGELVDHTCHDPSSCEGGLPCPHRGCINPDHLVATTNSENVSKARASRKVKTHCRHGHEFTPENTYTDKRGSRHCRKCAAARARE